MTKLMKGVFFPGSMTCTVEDVEVPTPGMGEVLLEMRASGMCGSDLEYIYKVPKEKRGQPILGVATDPSTITGHEPAGVVTAVGPGVRHLKVGDRVAVYHINGCGFCKDCRSGWHITCTEVHETYGFDRHGGNAQFMVADERDCVILPNNVSFDAGAFVACGAGTGFSVTRRLGISGMDDYLIFGAGPVGLSAAMFGKHMGARVMVVDMNETRLDMARALGVARTINPAKQDVRDEVLSFTNGVGASAAVDCSANPRARSMMFDCVKTWGRAAFVGEGHDVHLDVSPQIIHRQITLIGSWVYSTPMMMELLETISRHGLPLGELLVSDRFSLKDAPKAFERFAAGETAGKCVFVDF
ncbi:zinc-binding dehydrogenase [Neorhizobium sp. NCHU2750]|uniref:zinc-dependent alcohol dehydrogenase family protein n=1 Tax=Neorhizobium sp. NCHU2750 TaxID=1825976 RepID=UPI000E768D2E|nr:alcohol dehydrogenase [Neorhizobium sp. NCHU2750]